MMTEMPIPGLIGRLAVPTIVSMLVTSFYNMADTFFVGRIGTSATAAVGVAFPVMENDAAGELAATGFFGGLLLGCLVLAAGIIFLTPLSRILGSTETILPYTKDYLRIILIGAPYMTAQFVLNNQIRFQGNAFYAMIGVGTGAVLNIVLDPVLIFGFHMGISGAALATVISQFVSFLLLLGGVRFSGCIPVRLKNVRFSRERLLEIAGGGLPSLFRQGLGSVATMTLNIAANPYGDPAVRPDRVRTGLSACVRVQLRRQKICPGAGSFLVLCEGVHVLSVPDRYPGLFILRTSDRNLPR